MEIWLSGRRQRFAKPSTVERWCVGSNPTPSTNFKKRKNMLKPNKTFKLSKTTKRMIGLMKGATADQRNQFKRMMIDAQLSGGIVVKKERRDDK